MQWAQHYLLYFQKVSINNGVIVELAWVTVHSQVRYQYLSSTKGSGSNIIIQIQPPPPITFQRSKTGHISRSSYYWMEGGGILNLFYTWKNGYKIVVLIKYKQKIQACIYHVWHILYYFLTKFWIISQQKIVLIICNSRQNEEILIELGKHVYIKDQNIKQFHVVCF